MSRNENIREAKEELEYLNGDEEERRIAELRKKAIRDEVTNINHARKEGKKEKSIEIAKRMKDEKVDIDFIERVTGLNKEEIEKL